MTFTPKPAVKIEDQILADFMEIFDSGRLDLAGLSFGHTESKGQHNLVILILVKIQSSYKCT